jgi:hypothetical protein
MKLENILYLLGGVGIVYALGMNSKFNKQNRSEVAKPNEVVSEPAEVQIKVAKPSDKVLPPAPYNPTSTKFQKNETISFEGLTETSKQILNNEPTYISGELIRGVM